MSNVSISKALEAQTFDRMTLRQHRIYLDQKLLNPISAREREELVSLVNSVVSRLALHFVGDER